MQERFLEGRTALVTGSIQGIGLAIGKALSSAGARLAVHGLATREQADAAIRTMREAGAPDARFFDADMRKPAAINAMMDAASAWGGPDILVNNAGIQQTASLAEVTQQLWDDILAVNLSGAFHTSFLHCRCLLLTQSGHQQFPLLQFCNSSFGYDLANQSPSPFKSAAKRHSTTGSL